MGGTTLSGIGKKQYTLCKDIRVRNNNSRSRDRNNSGWDKGETNIGGRIDRQKKYHRGWGEIIDYNKNRGGTIEIAVGYHREAFSISG